jgi:hypothetical protein
MVVRVWKVDKFRDSGAGFAWDTVVTMEVAWIYEAMYGW